MLKRFNVFYCSTTCQSEHRIKRNETRSTAERGVMQRIKSKTKQERGNRCQVCSWEQATCDVHRIIPESQGGENIPDNLIVVCPNCHRLAHNNELSEQQLRKIVKNSLE